MKFSSEASKASFASSNSPTTPFALQGHQHQRWMGPPTLNYSQCYCHYTLPNAQQHKIH